MHSHLISISGRMGAGKDLVGKIIRRLDMINLIEKGNIPVQSVPSALSLSKGDVFISSHWKVRKFAAPLKQVASILTGVPVEKFEDQDFKKSFLSEEWNVNNKRITVRSFLQKLGTEAIRDNIHPEAWINALFNSIEPEEKTIITDTRFTNELDAINKHGGITINVLRNTISSNDEHSSESALDNADFDYTILNFFNVRKLEMDIKNILLQEGIL